MKRAFFLLAPVLASLFVFGNTPAAKAQDAPTLEGEWVVQSSWRSDEIETRYTIVRKGKGYDVISGHHRASSEPCHLGLYYGNPTRIIATYTPSYDCLLYGFSATPDSLRSAIHQLEGKLTLRQRITLSTDGHSAEMAADGFNISYTQTGRLGNYEVLPFAHKGTLVRIASQAPKPPAPPPANVTPQTVDVLSKAPKLPSLRAVPDAVAGPHPELVRQRMELLDKRNDLWSRIERHNVLCQAVASGSAREAACRSELASLTGDFTDHVNKSNKYNSAEKNAEAANQKAKECAQAQDCLTRCQCQYDNGVAGCNSISNLIEQSNCTNKRTSEWLDCRRRGGCE